MELRLPFPPTPEHMSDHAEHLVRVVRSIDGLELDFSIPSLSVVDGLLGRFHDAGDDPDLMAETLFQFGAYVGEVIVRQHGGSWVTVPQGHPMGKGWQPLVEIEGGRLLNPIGKSFKRVRNGAGDSIPSFYHLLVTS